MQVILLDKVPNVGNLGDIAKVKDGYARNFLIPTGRARRATAANKAEFEAKRAELEKAAAAKLAESQAQGEKLGGTTIRSIGHISRLQRVLDNDADYVTPLDMLAELRDDNRQLCTSMRTLHELCDEHNDVATASLIENWIDEAEQRVWFLYETTRRTEG